MKRVFRVNAVWDAEAEVFYSQSDIKGFHIEAPDLDEFEATMMDVAPELIALNHRSAPEGGEGSLEKMLPVILWQHPEIKNSTE